jgi:hypothetical protein
LQKPLEKQCAHKVANSEPRAPRCPATISPEEARDFSDFRLPKRSGMHVF